MLWARDLYPRRITFCEDGWFPDPVYPSNSNGGMTGVTYNFIMAIEDADEDDFSVGIEWPSVYSSSLSSSLSVSKIDGTENCYFGSISGVTNPAEYTSTAEFSFWLFTDGN